MKKISLLLLSVIIFSCSSETSEETTNENATDTTVSEDDPLPFDESMSEEEMAAASDADAFRCYKMDHIVVANSLKGREHWTTDAKVQNTFKFGQLLKSVDRSPERDKLKLDIHGACEDYGYHWELLEDKDQNRGWAYGQFVYKITWNEDEPSYTDGENEYFLGFAEDLGYGSSDEDGLTGCDHTSLLFFYRKDTDQAYPVFSDKARSYSGQNHFVTAYDSNLLFLMSGEGGGADLAEANQPVQFGDFYLKFTNGYQDGSNESKVWIGFDGEKFYLKKIENTPVSY